MKRPAKYVATAMVVLVSVVVSEGWEPVAKPPVKGDVCTNGFGSTRGVKCGDKTDPVSAVVRAAKEIETDYANPVRQCLGDTLITEGNLAGLTLLAYRVGAPTVCSRAAPGKPPRLIDLFIQGRNEEGCRRILEFNCGPSGNPGVTVDKCGKGKKILRGLQNRAKAEYELCMGG